MPQAKIHFTLIQKLPESKIPHVPQVCPLSCLREGDLKVRWDSPFCAQENGAGLLLLNVLLSQSPSSRSWWLVASHCHLLWRQRQISAMMVEPGPPSDPGTRKPATSPWQDGAGGSGGGLAFSCRNKDRVSLDPCGQDSTSWALPCSEKRACGL